MKRKNLDFLLENILKEEVPIVVPTNSATETEPEMALDTSLDAVIDRYIVRYEKESIPTTETYDNQLFANENSFPEYVEPTPMGENVEKTLNYVLNEAPEDDEELELDAGIEDEEDPFAAKTDETDAPAEPTQQEPTGTPVMQTPQINLNDFAMSIARLVNNFDTLLNPKEIILQRVEKYIQMNYDNRTAKELMDLLDVNYSLRTAEKADYEEEQLPTPYAAGALSTEG